MNKNMLDIIANALVTMGYRTTDFETYMKPIGFALLVAKIIQPEEAGIKVEIMLTFNNSTTGEINFWYHKEACWESRDINVLKEKYDQTEKDLYNEACAKIAYAEAYVGLKLAGIQHNYQTFAFKTSNDIF